jgi:hypothetical protein
METRFGWLRDRATTIWSNCVFFVNINHDAPMSIRTQGQ